MDAINNRLKQLENIETRLYIEKEATTQRRAREDEQLRLERQEEDRVFLESLREQDQEEDVSTVHSPIRRSMTELNAQELRRNRRILSRSSFGPFVAECYYESQASTALDNGPVTRKKTKIKRLVSSTIPSSSSARKDYGRPTARDSQGMDLFTRPSDGKLVYLHCCVPGCEKANFPNAMALRNHVCSPVGLHKIRGLITSNSQAIEVCGKVAPGQREPSNTTEDQLFGAVPVANMTRAGVLPSPPAGSGGYHVQSKASSRSISNAEDRHGATLSKTPKPFKTKDLAGAYGTRCSHNGSQTEPTTADEAAKIFDGFLSSDSEDSDESEDQPSQGRRFPAHREDQLKAASRATNPSTRLGAGATSGRECAKTGEGNSALDILAVDDQAIKKERSTSPSLFIEQSECPPSHDVVVVAQRGTEANQMVPNTGSKSITTHKRACSVPPSRSPPTTKRLRVADGNLKRLVRSCSRVVVGRGE